jgi:hypothetical protein
MAGSRAGIGNGYALCSFPSARFCRLSIQSSVKALLLSFIELRGDVFDAKVVGVDRRYCMRARTGADGLRSLMMVPLLWNPGRGGAEFH